MSAKVSIVRCKDYEPAWVFEATKKALDSLGGISAFIAPKSRVLVKPNLLMAKEPEFGICTHPEVVRAVIKVLKGINCSIYLGDGPSVWGNQAEKVAEVYEKSGMKKICEEEGVELVNFEHKRWRKNFPLAAWLDKCDCVVNMPKFKTHELTILTGAIKNLFGLVWKTYKTELHKKYFDLNDFSKIVVDVYEEIKPALTVIDGIVAMEGDGPATSGKLRNVGLLLTGNDCVALDSILALIMGIKPFDVLTTKEAATRGLGVGNIKSISVAGERLEDIIAEPFILPSTSLRKKIPRPIIDIARKLIKYYPCADQDNCIRCASCIQACPNKAITIRNDKLVFDYSKCISCFCCQEACPHAAIKIKRNIWAKMAGL
ncbi:MAG: DUF362 domain-containing protein [Candidatus Omnitrophota bacterium]|nr:DUF362 domain-containing protein [Candidatus Omnitrophota bacterium]